MPKIQSKIEINAPRDVVWSIAQDVEKLPDILPDLDALEVLEREQQSADTLRTVTTWHGRIKQFNRKIVWTEEDLWDKSEGVCRFKFLHGDLDKYEGEWRFSDAGNNKTDIVLDVEYEVVIPLVGALMQKVVQKIMQENSDGMLAALKKEAESRAAEA